MENIITDINNTADLNMDVMEEKLNLKFIENLKDLNIELTQKQLEQFDQFYDTMVRWNKVMNLTTIKGHEEVVEKHFIDSLSIVKILDKDILEGKESIKIMDLGTGAGFPGIPLKIVFPEIEIVLLDSMNKKVKFINEVIEQLGLTKITAIHGRAEDYAKQPVYREQFDLCVSRAVANLATLTEYCMPFVKVGGLFISYKSGNVEEELEKSIHAIHQLSGELKEVTKFQLPGSDISRSFVQVKKTQKTPKKYPRKAGLPGKEPLA